MELSEIESKNRLSRNNEIDILDRVFDNLNTEFTRRIHSEIRRINTILPIVDMIEKLERNELIDEQLSLTLDSTIIG